MGTSCSSCAGDADASPNTSHRRRGRADSAVGGMGEYGAVRTDRMPAPRRRASAHREYEVMEFLGQGSTAVCYKCRETGTGELYACKVYVMGVRSGACACVCVCVCVRAGLNAWVCDINDVVPGVPPLF